MPADKDRTYAGSVFRDEGRAIKLNPDARSLRGLAHPVRMQILDILRFDGPATASMLAERLGVATGSTSWHLQKLAEHGFIEEIPDRGNRRDRWWQSSFDKVLIEYAEAMEAGADQAQATTEYFIAGLSRDVAAAIRFLTQDWDFDWRYAAIFNKYDLLLLDPQTLVKMRSELWDILKHYTNNPSTTPDARRVVFTMQGYPYRVDAELKRQSARRNGAIADHP